MHSSSLLLLLLTVASMANAFRWLQDYDDDFRFQKTLMSRMRRGDKITACGGKVWKMVMASCGGECQASNTNIATKCCEAKCSMEEIVESCCKP